MITSEMIEYCEDLGKGKIKPQYLEAGLCTNFLVKFDEYIEYLLDFSTYPNFSGYPALPIKSPNENVDAVMFYIETVNKWTGEYGNERKRFCLWVAEELRRKAND
jgi:hypothetical protein